MIKLVLDENRFQINDVDFEFPVNVYALRNLLGEFRQTVKEFNTIYTWDDDGIIAYSKDGTWVEDIILMIEKTEFDFSSNKVFTGQFWVEEQDVFDYQENNENKLFRRFSGDTDGAFEINGIGFSLCKKNNSENVKLIQIFESKSSQKQQERLPVEEKYQKLIGLWEEWVIETTNIISVGNPYYNLTHGITQEDIEKNIELDLENHIVIPAELVNFYKIYNVQYDPVTSPFSFYRHNCQYDLLPFEKIKKDWEHIQSMNDEDDYEAIKDLIAEFDEKVKAINYANPGWIPFAESREGDYLLFDTNPSSQGNYGQIIELQNESWYRGIFADSLEELLQNEINAVKKGQPQKFDFMLDEE